MIPSTWIAALLFLLFVAPGLVFDLLSDRRRTLSSESTFREISRVALASTVFSGIVLIILLAILQFMRPSWLPELPRLITDGIPYAREHVWAIAWTLLAGTAASVILATATHLILVKARGGAPIRQRSAWTRIFRDDVPKGKYPYVRARLDDGTIYAGQLQDYSSDLTLDDRELVLRPPHLRVKRTGGDWQAAPDQVERIAIRGVDIRSISVTYWPDE